MNSPSIHPGGASSGSGTFSSMPGPTRQRATVLYNSHILQFLPDYFRDACSNQVTIAIRPWSGLENASRSDLEAIIEVWVALAS